MANLEIYKDRLYFDPYQRIKIPTGVYFNIPKDNMLLVCQKTSVPYNTGLISGARVIDANYTGQFIASIINTSNQITWIEQGSKFIQLVLVPVHPDASLQQTQSLQELYQNKNSKRGSGAFGSTGQY